MNNKDLRFGVYTSFFNAESYIDEAFEKMSKVNYYNWKWIITDDFSSDNTKKILLEKVKQYDFVEYIPQSRKKEMYWQPNKFFDISFDYIVLIDCDDNFDFDFLNVYNKILREFPDTVVLSSDFIKVKEESGSLYSLSTVKNDFNLYESLKKFHPQVDYVNNHTYNAFGVMRCFKNHPKLNFEILDYEACAEDSYRMMWMNSIGKWLHVPRCMYQWVIRENSESHSTARSNFNGNFEIAHERLKNNPVEPNYIYNDIYKETSSLIYLGLNELHDTEFCMITRNLDVAQKNKLKSLYFDCDVYFDLDEAISMDCELYVVICNYYSNSEDLLKIKNKIKSKGTKVKILFYYFEDRYHKDMDSMRDEINKKIEMMTDINDYYKYFYYFRHNYILVEQ